METLVVVAQHRNQFHSRVKRYGHARLGSSPPSKQFREINCRSFQSGAGILPTPSKVWTGFVSRRSPPPPSRKSQSPSSKTPLPILKVNGKSLSGDNSSFRETGGSPVSVGRKVAKKEASLDGEFADWGKNVTLSELWAGPAYSNSPPPSSLPMPKFSMKPKRTVSLDLPAVTDSGLEMHQVAKSAPTSPTRERNSSMSDLFLSADSATQTLRRILNLDIADD